MIAQISALIFSIILIAIPLMGLKRKVAIFESFVEGGKDGFEVVIKIIPFIVGMYVAIGMLRTSGFFDLATSFLSPLFGLIHFPPEILPLALLRPITGSGSIAILTDIISQHGPDSLIARTAATILGSTETTFYVVTVYFGAVSIKRYRHAIATGLIADLAGIVTSIIVCKLMFT
jgi:spore maturation protein B